MPEGTLVAIAGGKDIADPAAVIARPDKARAKYNDHILVHDDGPGIERIAARWAERNGVHQIVCKSDWNRHGRAAPFRPTTILLNFPPKGVIAFPGSGITDNLVDKARTLGISVQRVNAWRATHRGPFRFLASVQQRDGSAGFAVHRQLLQPPAPRSYSALHCLAQFAPQRPPLNRRGGSNPPDPPASIPTSLIPQI